MWLSAINTRFSWKKVLWKMKHLKQFYDEFITKKVVLEWSWHYKTSFLRLLWMCEFDTDVKIQLELSPWSRTIRFLLKRYISKHTGWAKRRVFVFQKTKNYNLFDKNRTQDNIKLTYVNRNWTGKLQITLLFAYKEIVLTHIQSLFRRSNRDASEKMKAKYMNQDVWKSVFLKLAD